MHTHLLAHTHTLEEHWLRIAGARCQNNYYMCDNNVAWASYLMKLNLPATRKLWAFVEDTRGLAEFSPLTVFRSSMCADCRCVYMHSFAPLTYTVRVGSASFGWLKMKSAASQFSPASASKSAATEPHKSQPAFLVAGIQKRNRASISGSVPGGHSGPQTHGQQ